MAEIPFSVTPWVLAGNVASLVFVLLGVYLVTGLAGFPREKRVKLTLATGGALAAWFLAAAALGWAGFFETTSTTYNPAIALLALPILLGVKALKHSPDFRKLVDTTPQPWIIAVQLYRVLGYFFLALYWQGLLPGEFAIPTGVGDMVIGLSAPLVAFAYHKKFAWSRNLAIAWNYLGIADLALSITLGILTSPTPLQALAHGLPNGLITQFPLIMIPVFAVPLSILLHLFSLRVLAAQK